MAADANKDKLLNFEEYLTFIEKEEASKKVRRDPAVARTREQHEEMFNAINKVTPGVDGVSQQDVKRVTKYASLHVTRNLRVPIPKLTEEVKGDLDKWAEEEAAALQKWTRAQKDAARVIDGQRSSPAGREAATEEFKKLFTEADADGDGRLNLEEWLSYVQKHEAVKAARGEPSTPKTKEKSTATYNVLNKVSPDADGVSPEDLTAGFSYGRRCVVRKLGAGYGREPPLAEEVRKEMEPILQLDVDFIKSWTPE